MENFHPPSVPSTKTITCTHEANHVQFSVCEPMSCFPSTPCPSASQYYYNPVQYLAPNPGLQFQCAYNCYPYPQASQPMYPFLVQPNVVLFREHDGLDQSKHAMGALISKAARTERRMARKRSLSLSRNNANAAAASEACSSSLRRKVLSRDVGDQGSISSSSSGAVADLQNINKHLYTLCTPDNKKLRALFKKELKNSDVGSLGRIVLPKRKAEEYLPVLYEKEGIQLVIRDFYSDQGWGFIYKYWSNNNSRMYLFENTGDFVKQNKLEVGDSIYLYEDDHKNLYISTKKVARPVQVAEPSSSTIKNHKRRTSNATNPKLNITNGTTSTIVNSASDNTKINEANSSSSNSNNYNAAAADMSLLSMSSYTYVARDEEDTSSLAQLIKQRRQEPEDNTQLVPLSMDSASSSYTQHEEANNFNSHIEMSTQPSTLEGVGSSSSSSQSLAMMRMLDVDDLFEFVDNYKGIGMLPEVDWYDDCERLFDVNM